MLFTAAIVFLALGVALFVPILAGLMLNNWRPTPIDEAREESDYQE